MRRTIGKFIGLFVVLSPLWGEAASLGTVEIDKGDTIQIRSLLSHGLVPSSAEDSRYSIELAIQNFGPIHGYKVELGEPIDSMCSAEGGRRGANKIIADSQVVGVIGTSCSGAAVAASPRLSHAGLVMISPSNTSPALTSDLAGHPSLNYHPGYFRTSNNDLYEADRIARFAYHNLGLRRIGTLDDGDPYTMGLTVAFGRAFRLLGGEVTLMVRTEKGDTDMTNVLTAFAALQPEGIFFPLFNKEGTPFVQQARSIEFLKDVTLITSSALLLKEFLEVPESLGVYFAGPELTDIENTNQATSKNVEEVLSAFKATYGKAPETAYWAHAYDATTLLLNAIKSVGRVQNGKLSIDRGELRQEIGATNKFQGLLGTLSCDDFGDCGTGNVSIYHHNNPDVTDPAQLEPVQ